MKKLFIIVFCVLLISCSENNVTSDGSNMTSNINNQLVENQVVNEILEEVEDIEEVDQNENTTSSSTVDVEEEEVFESFEIIVRVNELNVRSGPSIDTEILSSLVMYDNYNVTNQYIDDETREYWYEIQLDDGSIGWIAGWYVTRRGEEPRYLYSDMSLDADLVAVIGKSEIVSKEFRGIYSGRRLITWYETQYLDTSVYFDGYDDLLTITWPIYYKTENSLVEFAFSEDDPGEISFGYREIFIESSDGLIYISEEERKIYRENKSLGDTTLELEQRYSYNDMHILPRGYLYIMKDRNGYRAINRLYSSSITDVLCYEIVGNQLKERKEFKFEYIKDSQFMHAYDSPYKISNSEVDKYEYTGYVESEDFLGYRRYFDGFSTFDVIVANINGKEMYASYNSYNIDDDVTVILSNSDQFMMSTQSRIIESPLYNRGYINYDVDNSYYVTNYKSNIVLPYDNIFFIHNNQQMLIQNDSIVYIYDVSSSDPILLMEFELRNRIRKVTEFDDLLLIGHYYYNSAFLKREGDNYIMMNNFGDVAPVFKDMDLTSEIIGTDSLESKENYTTTLQVFPDKMLAWYNSGSGYILREVYDRNHINEGVSFSSRQNEFYQIINSNDQVVSGDLRNINFMPTNVSDSPYIIVRSSDKFYSINIETAIMTYLGTDVRRISDSNYVMTYLEYDKGSTIDLYGIGQTLKHLDTYEIDMVGGAISQWYSDRNYVTYSGYEGLQSVGEFLHHTVVFDIGDDALNPKVDDRNIYLDLYESNNYKSPIVGRLDSEELIDPISLNAIQLMDDEIIVWYELVIDNARYYVYKKVNQMEALDYAGEMLEIILEDDSITGFYTGGDATRYLLYDFLGRKGYLTMYHAWEGIYGTVINMNTGEETHSMPYNPLLSPDGDYIIGDDVSYGEGVTTINLYSINEDDVNEEVSFNIGQWRVYSTRWVNNNEITLKVYSERHPIIKQLRLVKEQELWTIKEAVEIKY